MRNGPLIPRARRFETFIIGLAPDRGVYPYLPMATNAPWPILGGGMKNQFLGE